MIDNSVIDMKCVQNNIWMQIDNQIQSVIILKI